MKVNKTLTFPLITSYYISAVQYIVETRINEKNGQMHNKSIKYVYFFTHNNFMVRTVCSVVDMQFISFPSDVIVTAEASTTYWTTHAYQTF
jgi:hypothetical protein